MRTEVDLQQVFRQADPSEFYHFLCGKKMSTESLFFYLSLPVFVKVLDQMRHGKLDEHSISCLKGLEREIVYEDGVDPVELLVTSESRLVSLEEENEHELTSTSPAFQLPGQLSGFVSLPSSSPAGSSNLTALLSRLCSR